MSGKNRKSAGGGGINNPLVKFMCLFLGVLMMLGVVFMAVSAFSPSSFAEPEKSGNTDSESEIGVGLYHGQSVVQSVTLTASDAGEGFLLSAPGVTLSVAEKEIILSADGNEYYYNKKIIVNPDPDEEGYAAMTSVGLVGGYHIAVYSYGAGGTDTGNDNPVYIEKQQGGDHSILYTVTKDNLLELTANFRGRIEKISDIPGSLKDDIFPAYIGGRYFIMAGSFDDPESAESALELLSGKIKFEGKTVSPNENVLTVHDPQNRILFETDAGNNMKISSPGGSYISTGGRMYKGYFTASRDNALFDGMNVINRVRIEDYVCSRLSAEMSPSEHAEMLKACAVIYRTRAYTLKDAHKSEGFDVCADCHCGVYAGCGTYSDNDRITNSVEATKGSVLKSGKELIFAVGSRSCMSTTVSASDAFGRDVPYLRSLLTNWEMEDSVLEDWTYEVSPSELHTILQSGGYGGIKGSIKSIEVLSRSDNSLYVTALKFTDIFGNEVTVNGSENIRALFGGKLPSAAFIVSKTGKPVTFTYYAEGGTVSEMTRAPSGYPGYFVFCGEGEGSGVGFSFSGASTLAKQEYTFDRILAAYFPDTVLSTAG